MSEPQEPEQQECDPDERTEALAAWHGLFDHHGTGERNHGYQTTYAYSEHDQHQGPAAT